MEQDNGRRFFAFDIASGVADLFVLFAVCCHGITNIMPLCWRYVLLTK